MYQNIYVNQHEDSELVKLLKQGYRFVYCGTTWNLVSPEEYNRMKNMQFKQTASSGV